MIYGQSSAPRSFGIRGHPTDLSHRRRFETDVPLAGGQVAGVDDRLVLTQLFAQKVRSDDEAA